MNHFDQSLKFLNRFSAETSDMEDNTAIKLEKNGTSDLSTKPLDAVSSEDQPCLAESNGENGLRSRRQFLKGR